MNSSKQVNQNYLPHNFLAEKMVLSCLIYDYKTMDIVEKNLSIEHFYFKNHQEIFRVLISMSNKNKTIDIVTLTTFLQENGLLEKIGGIKVLINLTNQNPNKIYLKEYIKLIKDKFLRRELIKLGYKAINSSYITNIPLEDILTEFEQQLFDLKLDQKSDKDSMFNTTELISQIFLELKENVGHQNLSGLWSGFPDLDALTQGFQKSDLIIIAGRPSIGKTAFSLTVCSNIIKLLKEPILFFSLEMSKKQLIHRLLAMETNINQLKLKNGKLDKNDWIKLNKVVNILSKLPFFIEDSYDISIPEIRNKLKRCISTQKRIGLIIIDYLQLMKIKNNECKNRAQEISQITRDLKNLAREFDIPIIALSQLSRNVENRTDKKPILSDLRESGSIEQDADLVLMITKNHENFNQRNNSNTIMDLIIAKQRNGPTGTIKLIFDKNNCKYINF